MIDFQTHPNRYNHWKIKVDDSVATLSMDISESMGLQPDYALKLNSYDLGVDIELYDAVQRLRFEHPGVKTVILTSNKERVFCSGANINMLAKSSHVHKVNFCKFTNETRMAIEDATACSKQKYICAINGTAAGGGYELALCTDYIYLVDDGASCVSLPEVPLLAVLPGTGGLTRIIDKRYVRRDHADVLCTLPEGIRGKRALEWKLIDELVPRSQFKEHIFASAIEFAKQSDRPNNQIGVQLEPLNRLITKSEIEYDFLKISLDYEARVARFIVRGPKGPPPSDLRKIHKLGSRFWPLVLARELDDAILHLRTNETNLGTWIFTSSGCSDFVNLCGEVLFENSDDWFIREITLYLKRVFKRIDVTSRSIIALVEPESCFAGILLELLLCADRSYMLEGNFEEDSCVNAAISLSALNFGSFPMGNGMSRLETRFLDDPERIRDLKRQFGKDLNASDSSRLGIVTFTPDDIDWEDEVRLAIEERASFSPDAMIGMEASLRFAGPETMETKIFGRLSAWQNWIFQRPNAIGDKGALKQFGTGLKANFDMTRV